MGLSDYTPAGTVQDWRTLPAGREMDALVAERVMGWLRVVGPCDLNEGEAFGAPPHLIADGTLPKDHGRVHVPLFSTFLPAAWSVVEHMNGDGRSTDAPWRAWNRESSRVLARAAEMTASELAASICRAALAATEAA